MIWIGIVIIVHYFFLPIQQIRTIVKHMMDVITTAVRLIVIYSSFINVLPTLTTKHGLTHYVSDKVIFLMAGITEITYDYFFTAYTTILLISIFTHSFLLMPYRFVGRFLAHIRITAHKIQSLCDIMPLRLQMWYVVLWQSAPMIDLQ